ncbi:MAG: hypothetical protein J6P03_02825 [Opitutales bacterium]|nr:hypothetical protein [Opitutales bacterium]
MLAIILSAVYVAFFHTLANPAHYAPFAVLGRARGWSSAKSALVAAFCGTGHLLSFILVAAAGLALNSFKGFLEGFFEAGEKFGFMLFLAAAIAYLVYGIYFAFKKTPSGHCSCCSENRGSKKSERGLVAMMFAFFALGPCDAVLPLVFYPAIDGSLKGVAYVAAAFYSTTIITMGACTLLFHKGAGLCAGRGFFAQRWSHLVAAVAILAAVLIGGLGH